MHATIMRTGILAVGIAALAAFAGCTSVVRTQHDQETDFSRYKTYSWHTGEKEKNAFTPIMEKNIQTAVDRELSAKGLVKRTDKGGDLTVDYRTTTKKKRFVDVNWNSGLLDLDIMRMPYDQGTLVIDIADTGRNLHVWRGAASGILDSRENLDENDRRIQAAVEEMFAGFPPR